jgi:hypothetical protein
MDRILITDDNIYSVACTESFRPSACDNYTVRRNEAGELEFTPAPGQPDPYV